MAIHFALGDRLICGGQRAGDLSDLRFPGRAGTVVGTTKLGGSCNLLGLTIPKRQRRVIRKARGLVAPNVCGERRRLYRYPAGGSATKSLGQIQYPFSAAVSAAPH